MKTYMFPGQGSQSKGMGEGLFDEFEALTAKADEILGYSIKELCLEDPRQELNNTQFTQPALFVVNALTYYRKESAAQQEPDFLIGHSLGEFNALLAAGCFDFETGLKLVKKRGELMSQAPAGAMAAILNASKEEIQSTLKKNALDNIDLANYNTFSQIVISGLVEELDKARVAFQDDDKLYYALNTSGAFHSRFMQPAMEEFAEFLKGFKFSSPRIPVLSNYTAEAYDFDEISETLAMQICHAVRWAETIEYLMGLGTDADSMSFEEIGHGSVLTKLVAKIKQEISSAVRTQATPSDAREDSLNERLSSINDANDKVVFWNANCPIGTKVKSTVVEGSELKTRTEAMVLFGHRAAVYMSNYEGYFDLDEIVLVE